MEKKDFKKIINQITSMSNYELLHKLNTYLFQIYQFSSFFVIRKWRITLTYFLRPTAQEFTLQVLKPVHERP